jgi:hypothetical protein
MYINFDWLILVNLFLIFVCSGMYYHAKDSMKIILGWLGIVINMGAVAIWIIKRI